MAKTTFPKPHVTLDMRGSACPGPILGAKRVLDDLLSAAADAVEVLIRSGMTKAQNLFHGPRD